MQYQASQCTQIRACLLASIVGKSLSLSLPLSSVMSYDEVNPNVHDNERTFDNCVAFVKEQVTRNECHVEVRRFFG